MGTYLGCRAGTTAATCEARCTWYAPPDCTTWHDCVVMWLADGGCQDIARNVPFERSYESDDGELVTFADYCP